jgi:hypothetical protein
MSTEQIILSLFLMLLGGACAFMLGRITKLGDAHEETRVLLASAITNIATLAAADTVHQKNIDRLYETKTNMSDSLARMETGLEHVSQVLPDAMQLMRQLAQIALRKAA